MTRPSLPRKHEQCCRRQANEAAADDQDGNLLHARDPITQRPCGSVAGIDRVELNSIDERVVVDRPGVRGAPAQRFAVGLAGASDVRSERVMSPVAQFAAELHSLDPRRVVVAELSSDRRAASLRRPRKRTRMALEAWP